MTTIVKRCDCKHNFQDKTHGAGLRVHNLMKDGRLRCTVCSSIKDSGMSSNIRGKEDE